LELQKSAIRWRVAFDIYDNRQQHR
jgi:hypothetical protein